jgi:hypothetical protein
LKRNNVLIIAILVTFSGMLLLSANFNVSAFNDKENDCATCHTYPATSLWIEVDKSSIETTPEGTFTLTVKGGGGTSGGTVIKFPSSVGDNSLFSIENKTVSDTTGNVTLTTTVTAPSTAGTYTLRVYITTGSGKNIWGTSIEKETTYKDITVKIGGEELDKTAWGTQVILGTVLIGTFSIFAIKIATRKLRRS